MDTFWPRKAQLIFTTTSSEMVRDNFWGKKDFLMRTCSSLMSVKKTLPPPVRIVLEKSSIDYDEEDDNDGEEYKGEPAIGKTNALSSTGHQKVSVHPLPLLPTLKQLNF